MTTYNILIEGQTIPVPEDIGASDANVKAALAPFYPDAANAMITRVEKDGIVTINVVKRAGTKGLFPAPIQMECRGAPACAPPACAPSPLAYLMSCPGRRNPAIELYQQLKDSQALSPEELLTLDARLNKVIEEGQSHASRCESALKRLQRALPQPAPVVPLGF